MLVITVILIHNNYCYLQENDEKLTTLTFPSDKISCNDYIVKRISREGFNINHIRFIPKHIIDCDSNTFNIVYIGLISNCDGIPSSWSRKHVSNIIELENSTVILKAIETMYRSM